MGRQRVMPFNVCSLPAYTLQELCCVWSPVGGQPEKLVMSPLLFTRHLTFCWSGRLCDGWIRPASFLTCSHISASFHRLNFFFKSSPFLFFFLFLKQTERRAARNHLLCRQPERHDAPTDLIASSTHAGRVGTGCQIHRITGNAWLRNVFID